MFFFLIFLALIVASIAVWLVVVGAKLQWLLIVNGTFVVLGAMVSLVIDRVIRDISPTVELAVMVVTAVVAWKGVELLRVFAEDRLRGGSYWSVRVFEFLIVGTGPALLTGVVLYALMERLGIPDGWLVVTAGSALVTGIAYVCYDRRFREGEARRRHKTYGSGLVYTHPSQFRS